jgi:hypothetical protein
MPDDRPVPGGVSCTELLQHTSHIPHEGRRVRAVRPLCFS